MKSNQASVKKTDKLATMPVGRLMFSLAVPSIIAQLVNILYNIIDRMFIGRLENGSMIMAGVGVGFPIITLITAFSSLIGMGGAPLAAIKMGQKDDEGAEKILGSSFTAIIIISVILTFTFSIFKEPLLWSFGASNATIEYAMDYLGIYVLGTIFVQISLGLNPFINTQGFTQIGMATVMIGAVINIILDPVLIFGLGMGVKGAALASIIGQMVSAVWAFRFLSGKKTKLKIKRKFLKPDIRIILSVAALGVSPFVMQSTESLLLICQNNSLLKYGGDIAVSSMTIMSSILQIITLPMIGLCQGAQPITSYNYGAGNMERVKKSFKILLASCLCFGLCMTGSVLIFPQFFVKMFNNNTELIRTTSYCMRIFFVGMTIFGCQIACQQTFLALGKAKISLVLALLRKVILLIPFIFIFPMFMEDKFKAVLLAEPAADIMATVTTTICFTIFAKQMFKNEKEN